MAAQLVEGAGRRLEPQGVPRHLHRGAAQADQGQGRRQGDHRPASPEQEAKVLDLMAALEASLEKSKQPKKTAPRASGRRSPRSDQVLGRFLVAPATEIGPRTRRSSGGRGVGVEDAGQPGRVRPDRDLLEDAPARGAVDRDLAHVLDVQVVRRRADRCRRASTRRRRRRARPSTCRAPTPGASSRCRTSGTCRARRT